jgi:2,4-dienoyl-CoA reductase-like NADH-dependent reductase (Old Yellow Enzyme family)
MKNKGEAPMSLLFQPGHIGRMEVPNRVVRSATWLGLAGDHGEVTPELAQRMEALARGGVGLVITGHAYVRADGQASTRQLGIHEDDLVPGLTRLARSIRSAGACAAVQLAHAGCMADREITGRPPVAVARSSAAETAHIMTETELRTLAADFGRAAARAREAGFDAVQLHAAHGYLLSQTLSPAFNTRSDDWGGDVKGRARLLLEVVREVRDWVGNTFPVLVKMNGQDFREGGLTLEDAARAAQLLQAAGVSAVEVSGGAGAPAHLGAIRRRIAKPEDEAYFREEARTFKQRLTIPVITVGGIRSFQVAEGLLEAGYADFVALSRPLIREPDLVANWAERSRAACVSCGLCFRPARQGRGASCVMAEREREKARKPGDDQGPRDE